MTSSTNPKNWSKIEIVVVVVIVVVAVIVVTVTIVVYLLGGEGDVAHDTPVLVHEVACVPLLDQYNL